MMKGVALEDDSIDEEVDTRVHRTTIVPPPDDLDIDNLGRAFPTHGELDGRFALDDPDLFDTDLEDPTRIDHKERLRQPKTDSTISHASSVGRSSTNTARSTRPPRAVQASSLRSPQGRSEHPRSEHARPEHARSEHPRSEHARSDKWYLRVQLDTDCVADLWIRDRTPHNVLVWSEDMASWVPLLTVRELRDAIRDAHDAKTREELNEANFVFVNTQGPKPARPLPEPRLPASLAAPVPARPTSHWSQPKPRTISNVPPPLLTTAVPIVATPRASADQQRATKPELPAIRLPELRLPQPHGFQAPPARPQAAQPRLIHPSVAAPASTVPPVVKPIAPPAATAQEPIEELHSGVSFLPEFPRSARVPAIGHQALTARPQSSPPPPIRPKPAHLPTRAEPTTRYGQLRKRLAALPLVHVERALWLAAGVAVSSATMLLVRDPEPNTAGESGAARRGTETFAATPAAKATSAAAEAPTERSAARGDDVHRIEDLPIVSANARHERADDLPLVSGSTKLTKNASDRPSHTTRAAVAPANIKLASSPTSSGSAFDASTARRVLTSSATRASRCAADGPASGSVVVTFAPSGFVQSASMSGLSGKGVNAGCVLRAFQEARVSPFSGDAVTVRKGFQIP